VSHFPKSPLHKSPRVSCLQIGPLLLSGKGLHHHHVHHLYCSARVRPLHLCSLATTLSCRTTDLKLYSLHLFRHDAALHDDDGCTV
jgi:hypothetical protein